MTFGFIAATHVAAGPGVENSSTAVALTTPDHFVTASR
jgi:hypothetical protein